MQITKPTRAAAYLRVSGKNQVAGDGFTRQREAVAAFATKTGLELVGEFADGGISGSSPLADRPGLSALFAKATADELQVILVEKADRLARDLIEGELLLREFRHAGMSVIEVEGGTDLTDGDDANPTTKLIRHVLGAVAEFDKSTVVGKLRAARDRVRAAEGRCEGVRPFGALTGEEAVLARLLALSRKPRGKPRRSLREIAANLNKEGQATRHGGPWRESTVLGILRRHGRR